MAYESVFDRVNWEDEPSVATPVNQNNLNKSDSALKIIDGRVVAMDSRLTQLEGYEPRVMGYAQDAENSKENSEAYATGTINGVDVTSSSLAYHNNSKWYSEQAGTAAAGAATSKQDSEAYAVGKVNGVDVTSSHFAFHNNAKWYSEQASGSATSASTSAGSASDSASDAEAYSAGTRQSSPVSSDDPAYHNNAKYYLEQAVAAATSAANSKDAAFLSEGHAHSSEIAAASSAYKASISATNAASSEHNASVSEGNAAISAASASSFASTADNRAVDSEAWAVGKRRGQDVSQSDETYHNNAKYWADQASQAAGGGVTSFNGRSQAVEPMEGDYTAAMVGLGNVDNTSDLNKPLSYAMSSALALKTPKSDIAPTEKSPSTHAYKQGDIFYYNGVLYKAKTAIAVDDVLTVGTNIETTTISATSGGHVIVDESGNLLTQRSKLKFMGGVSITDDSTDDETIVNIEGEQIQVTSLPTASAEELGKVYQYLGSTTSSYTHGYFYECVYENSTYYWKNIPVQDDKGTTIVQKPTVVVETYTYDGTAKSPTITWDTGMADNCVVTHGSETDAGNYVLTIALKNKSAMVWDDLTTTDLTYNWSIAKANQTITLSSNSVTLDPNNLTATVTISGAQGSISATTSDNTIATASVSGSTVTISNVNEASGSATITVSVAGTNNYNAATDSTISVTAAFYAFPDEWLISGGLNPSSYADLDAVLADEVALRRLFTIHDSVDHLVTHKTAIGTTNLTTILNNDYVAKWINLRDYALDTLYADTTIKGIMDTADKYFYGEWVITDSTTTPPTWGAKGNVPVMTSNTAPYGTASAYQVFDNSTSTTASGTDFSYQFTNPVCVKRFTSSVSGGTLQGSNDGSTWTTISTPTSNTAYYLHYRVHYSSSKTVHTIQFYGREMKVSVPTMTSNTAPYGEAIKSNESADTVQAWKAFNGTNSSAGDCWMSIPDSNNHYYIGYKFVNPTVIKKVEFTTRNISNTSVCNPRTYKYQGSNDGSTWIDLTDVLTNNNDNANVKISNNIDNDNSYLYYRMYILSVNETNNTNPKYAIIGKLQFYGLDYSEYDWDTDSPRKYIYDHGLELETIGNQYQYTSQYTNNPAIRNPGDIETKAPNSSSSSSFVTESKIDLNNYSYLCIRVSQMRQKNGTNYGQFWVSSVKDLYGTVNPVAYANTVDGMTIFVLDISSIADEYYLLIMSALSRWMNVCEWWLE